MLRTLATAMLSVLGWLAALALHNAYLAGALFGAAFLIALTQRSNRP